MRCAESQRASDSSAAFAASTSGSCATLVSLVSSSRVQARPRRSTDHYRNVERASSIAPNRVTEPGPAPQRLGACFSGGGFRASFFALGCARYLAEAALLPRLAAVSGVSGGSIAAAALADRWPDMGAGPPDDEAFLRAIDAPFRECITTNDLRNIWVSRIARGALSGRDRGRVLADTLVEYLYHHQFVAKLPSQAPQVIFTSTDLATGRALRISRDFIGSWDFDYVEPPPAQVELGAAVAASAAVPFAFPPVHVDSAGLGLTDPPKTLSLVDGGVYDNLGLEWFQPGKTKRPKSFVDCDFVIVVNASGLLRRKDKTYGTVSGANRSRSVQYSQTINLRTRWFVEDLEAKRRRGVYIGLTRDPRKFTLPGEDGKKPVGIDPKHYRHALPSELVLPLADLRTDLNRFLPEEAGLLSYHGYWSLHARLASLYPDLAVAEPRWRDYSDLSPADVKRLGRMLQDGSQRIRLIGKLKRVFGKRG